MKKSALRKQANLLRAQLDAEAIQSLSNQLLTQFSRLNFNGVKVLHIFLPIQEKNEPDTFLLIEWLRAHHPDIKIIVPKSDFSTFLMTHHVLGDHKELQKNAFNILEPQQGEEHKGDIDMVILPLLAFDSRGYRAGYGKGFYDRFLQGMDTLKVGLSLFDVSENIEDVNEHDLKLDLCITPGKLYDFRLPEA
ncbi:5-formyltetrahydrofolate cyclo-ligase [Pedobacter quisquiliarum]|uniref:5-formyltetrahydrofolate cyclo-ligase n=1 Tax=Pedobacter quisquiliarum TaxID=1834438 RepID=A0A916U105_9SPHI|nr:5-formyltetrahydrofolate cyclo-ligase [Pedobacter quisquiliarum]GGC56393.1 5-formyltetrahydrofolate cyclo-ligase [Pedobacter quisquiliarum]